MSRLLPRAILLAGVLAVVGLTGCDTKADKNATVNTNKVDSSSSTPEGGQGSKLPAPPPMPKPPPPPGS